MLIVLGIIGALISIALFFIMHPAKALFAIVLLGTFGLAFYGWIGVFTGGPRPQAEFLTFALAGTFGWLITLWFRREAAK